MKFIIAIIIFSMIILFHELGHFLFAKRAGIRVNEFSLGLGPTIFGITRGETKYSIKLLPFGGACMMEGEDGTGEGEPAQDSFQSKSVWARISVVFGGPLFNFIMAFVFAVILISSVGYDKPVIADVIDGYPAEEAGIAAGDEIIKINSTSIHFYREVTMYTTFHSGEILNITYVRDGEKMTAVIKPQYDEETGRSLIGIYGTNEREKGNFFEILKYSVFEVKFWIVNTVESLMMLFRGQVSVNDMSGPVGIVNAIGDTYDQSVTDGYYYVFINMLNIAILLSANLGVMNLLPLPALDGGRLMFLAYELITRKKVDPQKEGFVHFVGIICLLGLMVLIMFNDIRKLF
ncbi:MAG: RIP metalloprotease RseP [Lachnospiraceae bacterium]